MKESTKNKLRSIKYSVRRFCIKVYDFFRYDIPYGIESILRWFPVIWKDRNWDACFVFLILRKKIALMEVHHKKYGHFVDSDKTVKELRVCRKLLDRLVKDEYEERALAPHNKKWGETKSRIEPCKDNKHLAEWIMTRPNANTPEEKEQESKEFVKLYDGAQLKRRRDINVLFKIISNRVQTWWD